MGFVFAAKMLSGYIHKLSELSMKKIKNHAKCLTVVIIFFASEIMCNFRVARIKNKVYG